jgi:glutamate racemase
MPSDAHIVVTDSGLGGLSICALLEQGLRVAGRAGAVRLTYVNAWPFEDRGYNDLPDDVERSRVFDAVLARLAQMRPDHVLIACNTLSILYPRTSFSLHPAVPVHGIVDAGVELFVEHLAADPASSIVLLGTRTTIESGVHKARLEQCGIDPRRVAAASCHGLAAAIERDVGGPRTAELISDCAERAAAAAPPGSTLFLGFCCTHYGYVAVRLVSTAAGLTSRRVTWLDPNYRMSARLLGGAGVFVSGGENDAGIAATDVTDMPEERPGQSLARKPAGAPSGGTISVELVSKVVLSDIARAGIARLVEPISPATAGALLSYAHVPDLF